MPNPLAQFPHDDRGRSRSRGASGCSPTKVAPGRRRLRRLPPQRQQDDQRRGGRHVPGLQHPRAGRDQRDDGGRQGAVPAPGERLLLHSAFGPPQDEGGRQNISSRNTKHLRAFWDSVPRWLHHGDAHSLREILLTPDSPLLRPGERGFNFRTVRTDHQRAVAATSWAARRSCCRRRCRSPSATAAAASPGDGKGPLYVSLDSPSRRRTPAIRTAGCRSTGSARATWRRSCTVNGSGRSTRRWRPTTSGDQGHARQDLAIVRPGHRGPVRVSAVAPEVGVQRRGGLNRYSTPRANPAATWFRLR